MAQGANLNLMTEVSQQAADGTDELKKTDDSTFTMISATQFKKSMHKFIES